jgi:hypothetical protein
MKTSLCTRLGIEVPIIQAPMGGAVGPGLAYIKAWVKRFQSRPAYKAALAKGGTYSFAT